MKRGPLSSEIGRVLRGRRKPEETVAEVLGTRMAARLVKMFTSTRIGDATREGTEQLERARSSTSDVVRRGLALVLMVAERTSTSHARATGQFLYRGRAHTLGEDGRPQYVPSSQAGGLAARLGCSVREIDRYLAVLTTHGLWQIHQRPPTRAELEAGLEFGYAVYTWVGELPRELVRRLTRAYKRLKRPPETGQGESRRPISAAAQAFADALLRAAPT